VSTTRIDVFFAPDELRRELTGRVAVVIDVLRATSTIVEAMANGAKNIYPVATTEDAVRLKQALDRDDVLLSGERRSRPIEGFDLGNSPREFTPEVVNDKMIIMTTTNGTPALIRGGSADRCVVASFLNLDAVAADLAESDKPLVVLCSGREGRFALEDALFAGTLIRALRAKRPGAFRLNDAAFAATALERRYRAHLVRVISHTKAARQIRDAGLSEDIAYCLTPNRHTVVPIMSDRHIGL
jgi:2-phosphosulfolactate phosphatase